MNRLTPEQLAGAYAKLSKFSRGQQVAIDESVGGVVRAAYIGGSLDGVEIEVEGAVYHFGLEEIDRVQLMEIKPSDAASTRSAAP